MLQLSQGRHFLHEHPCGARSWEDPWVQSLTQHPKVHVTVSDQCEYGLKTPDANGNLTYAMKPTKWAISSAQIATRLSKTCSKKHPHQHLVGGRAAQAAFYPNALIVKILRRIRDTAHHEDGLQH